MADLFQCDKCGRVLKGYEKKGRLSLQELQDGLPHVSLYCKVAEVCAACFKTLKEGMNQSGHGDVATAQKLLAGR